MCLIPSISINKLTFNYVQLTKIMYHKKPELYIPSVRTWGGFMPFICLLIEQQTIWFLGNHQVKKNLSV